MIKKLKRLTRSYLHQTPWLLSLYVRWKFRTEIQLIRGRSRHNHPHPSIIHFSLNKAATQHTKQVLRRIAQENGMVPVHINEYAFYTRFPYLTAVPVAEMDQYQHIFQPQGYLYSAFGGMVKGIPEFERYKVILMVRDPRDILVSWYYSLAFSHSTPPEASNRYQDFMEKRSKAQEMTVDELVIAESDRVLRIYQRYIQNLLEPYDHVYLTSYEQMTSDYECWLRGIGEACDLEISPGLMDRLLEENRRLQPKNEDVREHIRKGEPGDYLDKLQPETIAFLNQKFEPIFQAFRAVWDISS